MLFAVDEEAFWGDVGPSVCLRRGDLLDVLRECIPQVVPSWATAVASAEPRAGCSPYSLLTIDEAPELAAWIEVCAAAWQDQ